MSRHNWITGFLVAAGILMLFPIYLLFMSSFKTESDLFVTSLWPDPVTLESIKASITSGFLTSLRNSVIVSVAVTGIAMILHAMCGYAVARMEFPGRKLIFVPVLLVFPIVGKRPFTRSMTGTPRS